MSDEEQSDWHPIVPRDIQWRGDDIQNRVDDLLEESTGFIGDPYSIVVNEFTRCYEKMDQDDPNSAHEIIREFIPFITTTAAVIESMSTSLLIFYMMKEDLIRDDEVFKHFNGLSQQERGILLDKLGLLPDWLSEDLVKFNKLRNTVVHEYQSHHLIDESNFDEEEIGDALLAGIRSAQGIHDLMDIYVPDSQFQ